MLLVCEKTMVRIFIVEATEVVHSDVEGVVVLG